jgi:hypothetical protein
MEELRGFQITLAECHADTLTFNNMAFQHNFYRHILVAVD